MNWLYPLFFAFDRNETSFAKRGFRCDDEGRREHLEQIGVAFVRGYEAALRRPEQAELASELKDVEPNLRGFAFEGAAMALGILDRVTPWKRDRVQLLLAGAGCAHSYMIHIALGWVAARIPTNLKKLMARLDPVLCWLVLDGYGFHEGFFRWNRYAYNAPPPRRVTGYARRTFDQGLGRSLWFVEGGNVTGIHQTVNDFEMARRPDLWSGVGLAAVYAGELTEWELNALRKKSGPFAPHLAQGAAFAAKARHRAGNASPYTDLACCALTGMSSYDAAAVTDEALTQLPYEGPEPAYEIWRSRVRKRFMRFVSLVRG